MEKHLGTTFLMQYLLRHKVLEVFRVGRVFKVYRVFKV
jgi:hypothetical protein